MNVYSVIWADDECDTLRQDKSIKRALDKYNIEVLDWVRTSKQLKERIEHLYDKVDAVIVDGNFSKDDVDYLDNTDISGLIHTLSFIEKFNIKRDIPFFLYTGRDTFLQEKCVNSELDTFLDKNRMVQKGRIGELLEAITRDVDHIKSVEFMVKKQYGQLLNMAEEVDPACEDKLYQFLLDEARDTKYNRAKDMFTALRQILEKIQADCSKRNICPKFKSLNEFGEFWGKRDFSSYECKPTNGWIPASKEIMPPTIACNFISLIKIIQDGSHAKTEMTLNVNQYVQETQNPFVFRSCLYQMMDVIRWYIDLRNKWIEGRITRTYYSEKEYNLMNRPTNNVPHYYEGDDTSQLDFDLFE